ncbi:MAG: tyrosine-type recombinase/integrase [Pirellulaceae bacterium]
MPKLIGVSSARLPKYRRHKATGQAVVNLSGKDFYLGPHGSKVSRMQYDRLVCEWLEAGRHLPQPVSDLTILELASRYWKFAKSYYVKNGEPTGTLAQIKVVLRSLRETYGDTSAPEFGPLGLKVLRRKMVDAGISRKHINKQMGHLVRVFRWAASEQLLPATVFQSLQAVPGLRQGRTSAPDHAPVAPVPEADVQAVLHYLPTIVSDMVRLQRLTGCRPEEVCILRPSDLDRSQEVWEYRPEHHKTQHRGRERTIFVGPKGQAILRPYLLRAADAYCFSPIDAEKARRESAHANRKTPMSCGNRPGTHRSRKPSRPPRDHYTTGSYRRAVHRACDLAGVAHWGVNRLRHSAATEIRSRFGLEAAQVSLGHAQADVTQVYAERDSELARNVMKQIG